MALIARDDEVRAQLLADGVLFDGYHPAMAAVHDANAARLSEILDEHGWPTVPLVGVACAEAAFRIVQHAINHPSLMRRARALVEQAAAAGEIPGSHFALLDDRIRTFEGLPQRFGTQWRMTPEGLAPYPIDDPEGLVARRREWQVPPPRAEMFAETPIPSPSELAAHEAAERDWLRSVGWR